METSIKLCLVEFILEYKSIFLLYLIHLFMRKRVINHNLKYMKHVLTHVQIVCNTSIVTNMSFTFLVGRNSRICVKIIAHMFQ